jgi:Spx/MgsR family transcriptional regulator
MAGQGVVVYGIANCDTMKKARAWLDAHEVLYTFHDYRKDGVDDAKLARWCKQLGWEALLNRAGTTFRALSDEEKRDLCEASALHLMRARPAVIKRPILEQGKDIAVGFKPERYAVLFG